MGRRDRGRTHPTRQAGFAVLGSVLALPGAMGCTARHDAPLPGVVVPPSRPREAVAAQTQRTPTPPPLRIASPGEDAPAGACEPFADLRERREGDLTVPVEPVPIRPDFFGRLRHHADGSLTRGSPRVWFGPRVPRFVPLYEGSSELHLLEPLGDGFAAFYRDPYGSGSCALDDMQNCRFVLVGYEHCGGRLWSRDLRAVMSRPSQLEIQDVRVADGIVYFNEACQSYSRELGGQCSALVAFDPSSGLVLWRTGPLVSNNRLLVVGDYVIAAYGFTAEADHVSLVRRRDGKVTSRLALASAHEDLVVDFDSLVVRTYPGNRFERFTMSGLDGDAARLTPKR